MNVEALVDDLGADVRTTAHHPTASEFCVCRWVPDPVPQNPDGSGDHDAMERMGRIHRMEEFLKVKP